jgi:hypothetical protein
MKSLRCSSGKIKYPSEEAAEEALLGLWIKNEYTAGQGPVGVYRCDDCGEFHLTSKGTMSDKLQQAVRSEKFNRQKEAKNWEDKLKRK